MQAVYMLAGVGSSAGPVASDQPMQTTIIMVLLVMVLIGAVFGLVLALVNKRFSVEINPLIHLVEDALPKGQCAACGYPGCMGYAEAVVLNPDVPPNLCAPGKAAVAEMVAELTGKSAPAMDPQIAFVRCAGAVDTAEAKYQYSGVDDCVAANILQGGQKSCQYGCLGFGTCVKGCPFNALTMTANGLPFVDTVKCTGCGKCATLCPKSVIEMVLVGAKVTVVCNSKDKGAVAKKNCTAACIGCGLCAKNCGHGAVKMANSLAYVDAAICIEKCTEVTCVAKCPTKAIGSMVGGAQNKIAV